MRRETKGWIGFVGLLALAGAALLAGCISVDRRGGVLVPIVRLDVPAEGSDNLLFPGETIDILAHILVPEGIGPYTEVYVKWCWVGGTGDAVVVDGALRVPEEVPEEQEQEERDETERHQVSEAPLWDTGDPRHEDGEAQRRGEPGGAAVRDAEQQVADGRLG